MLYWDPPRSNGAEETLKRSKDHSKDITDLGECTIVPDVTVVRETVADETQATLLNVLFDGIKWLFFADLHLRVRPARDLNYHVENSITLVGKKWNVVEG